MKKVTSLAGASFFVLTLASTAPLSAAAPILPSKPSQSTAPIVPVVVFVGPGRETVSQFATKIHQDADVLRKDYAASGIVRCGDAHGAGQLTLSNSVITTAAHVFFDEKGRQRAKTCQFQVMRDGALVSAPVDMSSIVAGSRNPYAISAVHDWAAAKLETPVLDATPYQIAPPQPVGAAVKFVARGHIDWGHARRLSLQDCRIRDQIDRGAEGTREFAFDCDTGDGASGGALMTRDGVGRLVAVLVGYRSIDPEARLPFSKLHYNFVVSVEGAFRDAVEAMANPQPKVVAASGAAPAN